MSRAEAERRAVEMARQVRERGPDGLDRLLERLASLELDEGLAVRARLMELGAERLLAAQ